MSVRLYYSPFHVDPATGDRIPLVGYLLEDVPGRSYTVRAHRHSNAVCFVLARADDWSLVDADPLCLRLSPDIDDLQEWRQIWQRIRDGIQTVEVRNLPQAVRSNWSAAISALGVNVSDIGPTTTALQLLRKLFSGLDPGNEDAALSD